MPVLETARAADQLRRSYYGQAWHGPALLELLDGITAEKASARSLKDVHSIWEIVLHIAWYERATLQAFRGGSMPKDEDDWPQVTGNWETAQSELRSLTDELAAAIETFPVSRLEDIVPGREYSFAFLMHGITQHNLYHAGQIAILRK